MKLLNPHDFALFRLLLLIGLMSSLVSCELFEDRMFKTKSNPYQTDYARNKAKDAVKDLTAQEHQELLKNDLGVSRYEELAQGMGQDALMLLSYGIGVSNVIQLVNVVGDPQKILVLMNGTAALRAEVPPINALTVEETLTLINTIDEIIREKRPASLDTIMKIGNVLKKVNNAETLIKIIRGAKAVNGQTGLYRMSLVMAMVDETVDTLPRIINEVATNQDGINKLLRFINEIADLNRLIDVINGVSTVTNLISIMNGVYNDSTIANANGTTTLVYLVTNVSQIRYMTDILNGISGGDPVVVSALMNNLYTNKTLYSDNIASHERMLRLIEDMAVAPFGITSHLVRLVNTMIAGGGNGGSLALIINGLDEKATDGLTPSAPWPGYERLLWLMTQLAATATPNYTNPNCDPGTTKPLPAGTGGSCWNDIFGRLAQMVTLISAGGAANITAMVNKIDKNHMPGMVHLVKNVDRIQYLADFVNGITGGIGNLVTIMNGINKDPTGDPGQEKTGAEKLTRLMNEVGSGQYANLIAFMNGISSSGTQKVVTLINGLREPKMVGLADMITGVTNVQYMIDFVDNVTDMNNVTILLDHLELDTTPSAASKMIGIMNIVGGNDLIEGAANNLGIISHMVRLVNDLAAANGGNGAKTVALAINDLSDVVIPKGYVRMAVMMNNLHTIGSTKYTDNNSTDKTDPFGRLTSFVNSLTGTKAAANLAALVNGVSANRLSRLTDMLMNSDKVKYMSGTVNGLENISLLINILNATKTYNGSAINENRYFTSLQTTVNDLGRVESNSTVIKVTNSNLTPGDISAPININVSSTDVIPTPTAYMGANNTDMEAPDNGYSTNGVYSPVTISGVNAIDTLTKLRLTFTIDHQNSDQIAVKLTGPDNTSLWIMKDSGGISDGFANLTLDDAAATSIASVGSQGDTAVISGTYKPKNAFSTTFYGKPASATNGTWTLSVYDDQWTLIGRNPTLKDWNLYLETTAPTAVPIPDNNATGLSLTLAVAGGPSSIANLDVTVNATHPNNGDLFMKLKSPTGLERILVNRRGSSGDHFVNVKFDDEATRLMSGQTAIANFSGSYIPEQSLSSDGNPNFRGINSNGTWTLGVADNAAGNTGTLNNWTLSLSGTPTLLAIPDGNSTGVTSTITSSGPDSITALTVKVNLTHPNVGDLTLILEGPDTTRVLLSQSRGGTGDNFTNTVFSSSAETAISAGSAPFSGAYRPEGSLSSFNGKNGTGTWKLLVKDNVYGNTGTLDNWTLVLEKTMVTIGADGDMSKMYTLINHMAWDQTLNGGAGGERSAADQKRMVDMLHDITYCGINPAYDLNNPGAAGTFITPSPGCNGTNYVRMSQFLIGTTDMYPVAVIMGNVLQPSKIVKMMNGVRDVSKLIDLTRLLPGEVMVKLLNTNDESKFYTGLIYMINGLETHQLAGMTHYGTGIGDGSNRDGACNYFPGMGGYRMGQMLNLASGQTLEGLIKTKFGWRHGYALMACGLFTPNAETIACTGNALGNGSTRCQEIQDNGNFQFPQWERETVYNQRYWDTSTNSWKIGDHTYYYDANEYACEHFYPESVLGVRIDDLTWNGNWLLGKAGLAGSWATITGILGGVVPSPAVKNPAKCKTDPYHDPAVQFNTLPTLGGGSYGTPNFDYPDYCSTCVAD